MTDNKELNPYLDGHDDWISAIDVLVQNVPLIKGVDLIIEGCIGGNDWCAYWVSQAIPNAIYVGTDLAPALPTLHNGRVDDGVDAALYQRILAGQGQLKTDAGESRLVTLRGNCFSLPLIQSLQEQSQAQTTMLLTFNGLVGLLGQDYVPGERKKADDITPIDKVVASDLFDAQLHLTELPISLWDAPVNVITRWYHQAEKMAQEIDKQTIRIKDGLVILK